MENVAAMYKLRSWSCCRFPFFSMWHI